MDRYVAFLRGMNLGGRRIKNEELRAEFEALGFAEVACFRASGNVVFTAAGGSEAAIRKKAEAGLGEGLGYEVVIFLRSVAEEGKIAKVFYPVFPPDRNASEVLAWLRGRNDDGGAEN